jgi:hypothetical protein
MKELWNDYIKPVIFIIIIFMLSISLLLAMVSPLLLISCNTETKYIGIPHKWGLWSGCLVQENGNWIPLDNWRYFGNK